MASKNMVIKRMFEGFDYLENMLDEATKFPEGTKKGYHLDTLMEIDEFFWDHQMLLQRIIESVPEVVMTELENSRPEMISFVGLAGADPEGWRVNQVVDTNDGYKYIFKIKRPTGVNNGMKIVDVTVDIRYYKDPMWYLHAWVTDVTAWAARQDFSDSVREVIKRWRDAWMICLG